MTGRVEFHHAAVRRGWPGCPYHSNEGVIYRPLRILHSTLCTRVLLNLRKAAARRSSMTLDEYVSQTALTVAFNAVGGEATLDTEDSSSEQSDGGAKHEEGSLGA